MADNERAARLSNSSALPRSRRSHFRPLGSGGARGREDDAALLRALHDEHANPLWRYVLGLTNGDASHAEDIVQETLLRAWRNPDVLDQSSGSARAWLFTVARRIVIDEWRSARSRREFVSEEVPELPVSDRVEVSLDRRVVSQALSRLSREHREVLLECYVRDGSVAETALRLGIPAGTVKSRTHYALRAFRLAMEELGETGVN